MKNEFNIPFGLIIEDYHERVMKSAHIIDALGNVAVFGDVSPIHLAAVQEKIDRYGVLLVVSEQGQSNINREGQRIHLEYSPDIDPKVPTPEQCDAFRELSSTDKDSPETEIGQRRIAASRRILPLIYHADIAIVPSGLYFNQGSFHESYTRARDYIAQAVRDLQTQGHREFNAKLRSHMNNLGYSMKNVPKPELGEERRQQDLERVYPEFARLLSRAGILQLADFDTPHFAATVASVVLPFLGKVQFGDS